MAPGAPTGIVQHWRETGSHEALAMGGRKPLALEAEKDFVERLVEAHDDWSEQALAAHIEQQRGVRVHPAAVGRLIRKMGWRFKKTLFASERNREDVAEARAAWRQWQTECDISKLVFLDETGAATDMIRRYGRAT